MTSSSNFLHMRRGVATPSNKLESDLCGGVCAIFEKKKSKYLESEMRYKRSYT